MHICELFCHNQGICLTEYRQVAKYELFHERSSCRSETSILVCSTNQRTWFCITGTSIMKCSRRSSPTYIESLFLHVVKHNLLFLSVFLSGFFFANTHSSQDSSWRGRLPPYILSTTSNRLTDTWTLAGLLLQRA